MLAAVTAAAAVAASTTTVAATAAAIGRRFAAAAAAKIARFAIGGGRFVGRTTAVVAAAAAVIAAAFAAAVVGAFCAAVAAFAAIAVAAFGGFIVDGRYGASACGGFTFHFVGSGAGYGLVRAFAHDGGFGCGAQGGVRGAIAAGRIPFIASIVVVSLSRVLVDIWVGGRVHAFAHIIAQSATHQHIAQRMQGGRIAAIIGVRRGIIDDDGRIFLCAGIADRQQSGAILSRKLYV